ncbi:MAG: SPASM domain-containing protein [Proteobacteria bacterium]|nr:SPASM domain-containing protein [Pseudomonadota bacterium]
MTTDRNLDRDLAPPIGASHPAAGEWRAFSFATGHFLLHIPSSHVLEVPEVLALEVTGAAHDPAAAAELLRLASTLPRPQAAAVKADIRAISLNMAQGCNLRCTYCFAGEGDYGAKGMMSFATATAAIALLAKDKPNFHVVFFGGEPMLNFSVMEQVVDWCEQQPLDISFSITTNGTLLTADKLAWFKAKKFGMNLSYDGKGLQARQRLNPDKVSNSEALVERKLALFADQLSQLREFRLRATVTRGNLDLLEESLLHTLSANNFKVLVAQQATEVKGLKFSKEDIDAVGAILRRVIDRCLESGDYERLLRLDHLKQILRTIHRGKTGGMACGAGVHYLTVSVGGGFYLCHRFNEDESERFGGVDEGLNTAKLDEIVAFRTAKKAPCDTCWMREWCAGGCFHEHKTASGDKFSIDPRFCQLQDREFSEAMRVYTVLLQKAPHLLEA